MVGSYSYETGVIKHFGTVDYVIFALTLAISAAIGFFYAVKDRKKRNTDEFLMAGRKMHYIPVSMSMVASFMSAVTLLGNPAEMYNYSTMWMWLALGQLITMAVTAQIYVPIFYNLKLTSAYEYLEKRFSKGVRAIGTIVFILWMLLYMAVVLYGPSLALNAVTGISLWGTVVSVAIICTLYTTLGGMKAVLWTDTFQTVIMIVGVLVVLIEGCRIVGGISEAWNIAYDNERIDFTVIDPDPRVRHSIWSVVIGSVFNWLSLWSANQTQVQRVLSCKSLTYAKIAVWLNIPGLWIILTITCLSGIVMYAFYHTCDPLSIKLVSASDQLFPLFVMDILGDVQGVPGLFVASVFSGSLSTISSGLNSISAILLEDIIKPFFCHTVSDARATTISKITVIVFGMIVLGLAFAASYLGGILQAAYAFSGVMSAPLFAVFTLGMVLPWTNKWGVYVGVLCSISFTSWLCLGSIISKFPKQLSRVNVYGCLNLTTTVSSTASNFTTSRISSTTVAATASVTENISSSESIFAEMYKTSYLWYGPISFVIVVVLGIIISFITGATDPKTIDPDLMCPIFDVLFPCLPERTRKFLRFGVNYKKVDGSKATGYDNEVALSDIQLTEKHVINTGIPEIDDKKATVDLEDVS